MSSDFSPAWSSPPPVSVQQVPVFSTNAPIRDVESHIREFWSSFPCPPPWKPHLLIEVNASRLDPRVGRTVQTFLAGKCDIQHVLLGTFHSPDLDSGDVSRDLDLRPTDASDSVSSMDDPAASDHSWCDTACQLSIGCAVFFVIVAMMVAVLICITKHRVRHKMASTRPSRQQLQLSASTSDAVNCTDFSNLEVQGDDDIVYPPFRHRGLPHPPLTCHPSCDPKWNCPTCSPCHPLMRISPASQYYSHAYSAVYETIDDDEDDMARCDNENCLHSRGGAHGSTDSRKSQHSCVPCQVSPSSVSTVQIRPRARDDLTGSQQMAETGFNGEENTEHVYRGHTLPKYFELEHDCALAGHFRRDSLARGHDLAQSTPKSNSSGECHNFAFSNLGHPFPPVAYHYPNYGGSSLHSFLANHSQQKAVPSANESYKMKTGTEPSIGYSESGNQLHSFFGQLGETTAFPCHGNHNSDIICHEGQCPSHQSLCGDPLCHPADPTANHVQVSAATPGFPLDIPNHYFCHTCQLNNAADLISQPASGRIFHEDNLASDLLDEASEQARRPEQSRATPTSSVDSSSADNNEVPLRKPVLALHSQYFAKSSAA